MVMQSLSLSLSFCVPLAISTTYAVLFTLAGDHDDGGAILLQYTLPKVAGGGGKRALRRQHAVRTPRHTEPARVDIVVMPVPITKRPQPHPRPIN
jgi:hypothetical protein